MKGFDALEFNAIGQNIRDNIKIEPMDWVIPEFSDTSPSPESPANGESTSYDATPSDWDGKLEKATIAAAIAEYFEPTCELCPMELNSLERAIEHYRLDHQMDGGFLKCCGRKIRTATFMEKHIRMHLNGNDEPELLPMKKRKKPADSIQRKKAKQIAKRLLPTRIKKTENTKDPLSSKNNLSKLKESRLNEEKLVKTNDRKRCFICRLKYKRDRKVQTTCVNCQKHTCNDHAVHTIKCYECVDVPLSSLPSLGSHSVTDGVRKRCVFCPTKLSRKVRQLCLCCARFTCNEHAIVTRTCETCVAAE